MNRSKNRLIMVLPIIIAVSFFFTSPTLANPPIGTCFNRLKRIISPPPDLRLLGVKLSELTKLESLGTGVDAEVFKVKYQEKEYAFRTPILLSERSNFSYQFINPEEKKTLSQINLVNAEDIISILSKKEILNDSEMRFHAISDTVINFDYLTKLDKLYYQGKRIAPKIIALVKNKDGVIVGQLMELIPGTTMTTLIRQKKLTKKMYDQIYELISAQIKILHENGFAHGDLGYQNIMVDFPSNSDKVSVRLVDFNVYYKLDSMRHKMNKDLHNLLFIKEYKKDIPSFWKKE